MLCADTRTTTELQTIYLVFFRSCVLLACLRACACATQYSIRIQTYLSQVKCLLEFECADGGENHNNKNDGEAQIAYNIKMRAREHIEILWGLKKRRSQRRESLF